ncbi:MAG: hypothetical protein WC668_03115 [Patescibacteria group bacterium]|jgi:hypothetical protein
MEKMFCPICRRSHQPSRKKIPALRRLPKIPRLSNPGTELHDRVFWGCKKCGNVFELTAGISCSDNRQSPLDRYFHVYAEEIAKVVRYRQIVANLEKDGTPPPLIDFSPADYLRTGRRKKRASKPERKTNENNS